MKTLIRPGITLCACLFLAFRLVPANPVAQAVAASSTGHLPFVVNNSAATIYYKPESRKLNPGKHPDGAYPLAPGEALYFPVDAVATPAMAVGDIYRVPDGSRVTIDKEGHPHAANFIAAVAVLINPFSYGEVHSPCQSFVVLANPKPTLLMPTDLH